MRMLLLAGGVAIAVLAVVVVVGLDLVGEDEPPWSEQASAACERGIAEAREVISAGEAIANDEKRALDVYAGATAVEADVIAELDALPRPAADELAIERTLTIVAASHRADVAAIGRLRRSFDRSAVRAAGQRHGSDPRRPTLTLRLARRRRLHPLLRSGVVRLAAAQRTAEP